MKTRIQTNDPQRNSTRKTLKLRRVEDTQGPSAISEPVRERPQVPNLLGRFEAIFVDQQDEVCTSEPKVVRILEDEDSLRLNLVESQDMNTGVRSKDCF